MEETTSRKEIIEKLSEFVIDQRKAGQNDEQIRATLEEKNVDAHTIDIVMRTVNFIENQQVAAGQEEEGSGLKGWIVWIALIIGVNVLSAVFDWGFWIY